MQIPFNNLRAHYLAHRAEIDDAVARVLDSGWYVLGQEVAAFEQEFAEYLERKIDPQAKIQNPKSKIESVGVNSGTDALQLALRACGVTSGHEVITVSHTAVATAAAIRLAGATPVLIDVDPRTYTLDPAALEAAITPRTRAIVPVHLYGHPAAMCEILNVVEQASNRLGHKIYVIEDCAQAHGAMYFQQPAGTLGDLACFSFYPTKNLGALGDGGAVVGPAGPLTERVRELREYGWSAQSRYVSQHEGLNSRLDELQAAILRGKLRYLDADNANRRALAAVYAEHLPDNVVAPVEVDGCEHVYHLYVIRTAERDALRARLVEQGIGTGIHYPVPVHQQPAYAGSDVIVAHNLSQTERLAGEILSLPLHPTLTVEQAARVVRAVNHSHLPISH